MDKMEMTMKWAAQCERETEKLEKADDEFSFLCAVTFIFAKISASCTEREVSKDTTVP